MNKKSTAFLILLLIIIAGGIFACSSSSKKEEAGQNKESQKKERKILYYRNPMNPSVTSPEPMKDNMGMDYVPVYEESEVEKTKETAGTVKISPEKIQNIGVKSEMAKKRNLRRTIRTVGRVDHDEAKVFDINTKIGGWVEKLYVNRTDQMVEPGERLLELYSPELVSAQEEYLLAFKAKKSVSANASDGVSGNTESLLAAARQRLKYWDISDDQIKRLEEDGKVKKTLTIYAKTYGIVTEKMVNEGMRIEPGTLLFKIIDHSSVWVYGEVYEYEMPFIKIGQHARIIPSYAPEEVYTAPISHIYTHFGSIRHEAGVSMEETRTAKIRFELANPEHKLKLGMYVNIELSVDVAQNAVAVPDSAVINTGTRNVVIVDKGDGRFEPRDVKVGGQADGYFQIVSGIKEGEKVVTSGNFLIDSEASFKAAVQEMKGH